MNSMFILSYIVKELSTVLTLFNIIKIASKFVNIIELFIQGCHLTHVAVSPVTGELISIGTQCKILRRILNFKHRIV